MNSELAEAIREANSRARVEFLLKQLISAADTPAEPEALRLLDEASPEIWLKLDTFGPSFLRYSQERSSALRQKRGLLGTLLTTFDPDGYARQPAVKLLSELDGELVLPVLALRAADWVSVVRKPAREAISAALRRNPVWAVPLIPVAAFRAARRFGDWLEFLLRAKLDEDVVLRAALVDRHRTTRRLAYRTGLKHDRLDVAQLLHGLLRDDDLTIRHQCANKIITQHPEALPELLRSSVGAIRAKAIFHLGTASDAEAALTDRSEVVRGSAQAALRANGQEPIEIYRRLPVTPAVMAGLGETGSSADIDLLVPQLSHPLAGVRRETVRSLVRLRAPGWEVALPLLADPSPKVVQAASAYLSQHPVPTEYLEGLLDPRKPDHVRWAAFHLLRDKDAWTRLVTDLRLAADPLLGPRARTGQDWMLSGSFRQPSPDQVAELRRLAGLPHVPSRLREKVLSLLPS